jgi:hypothetical protein
VPARWVIALYWAGLGVPATIIFAVPAWEVAAWIMFGVLAAAAIVAGVVWHRPGRSGPWALLSTSIVVSVGADVLYFRAEADGRADLTGANLLYLCAFVLSAVALLSFGRSGSRGAARAGLLDALTATMVLLLLVWVVAISPTGGDAGTAALIGYPIGDALLLATAVRLLTRRRRTPAVGFLLAGVLAALVSDTANGLVDSSALAPGVVDVGWLLYYACWGAAALHPTMFQLTAPEVLGERELTLRRIWVVAVSALVPPAILLVEALTGEVRDGVVLALASVVLILFSLARVAATGNRDRRSLLFRDRHDTLTGLANRVQLTDRVTAAVADRMAAGPAIRPVAGRPDSEVAMMLVDLDDFIPSAMRCWSPSPVAWYATSADTIWWPASAATSSRSSSPDRAAATSTHWPGGSKR